MPALTELVPGVLVGTSELYTTTTTVVAAGGDCLVIDPAVTPADLSRLAGELTARGLVPAAGWSTHPHWDHVLWSGELGDVPRYASPRGAAVAADRRDRLICQAAREAPGHDAEQIARLTALAAGATLIPWAGPEAEVVVHDGHAPGHGAVFLRGAGVVIAGDMCSDIEIPLLDLRGADPAADYRGGLERLAALAGVRWVIPGHGHVGDAAEFRRRIAMDMHYLDSLERAVPFDDPRTITAAWLRAAHERQLDRARG